MTLLPRVEITVGISRAVVRSGLKSALFPFSKLELPLGIDKNHALARGAVIGAAVGTTVTGALAAIRKGNGKQTASPALIFAAVDSSKREGIFMKRILLFIFTNLAIILILSNVLRVLGVDRILDEQGVALNLTGLLVFAAVFGFGGSISFRSGLRRVFLTRPPLERRIEALRRMKQTG